jgi:hypothetical protein
MPLFAYFSQGEKHRILDSNGSPRIPLAFNKLLKLPKDSMCVTLNSVYPSAFKLRTLRFNRIPVNSVLSPLIFRHIIRVSNMCH